MASPTTGSAPAPSHHCHRVSLGSPVSSCRLDQRSSSSPTALHTAKYSTERPTQNGRLSHVRLCSSFFKSRSGNGGGSPTHG